MTEKFLWITKDSTSETLSHSSCLEEARIRRHVRGRQTEAPTRGYRRKHTAIPASLPVTHDLRPAEKRSLHYFAHRTAPEWSGWQDSAFWTGVALQASQQNLAIAHGLVAIAAWHESSSTPSDPESASGLGRLAAAQHSRALRLLSTSENLDRSISLISCVVLASLQSFGGQYQEYRLLGAGAAMLDEALRSAVPEDNGTLINAATTVSQVARPLISRLQERLCMMGDMPAALAHSVRYPAHHRHARSNIPRIPKICVMLREARDCLEAILICGQYQVAEAHDSAKARRKFQDVLSESIKRWEDALEATKIPEAPEGTADLLRIAALTGMILLLTCCTPMEIAFDTHYPIFGRIMRLVLQLSPMCGRRGRVSFGIDCGLIDIVAFVGSRCRDPKIRRSALEWLKASTRIEGERLSNETAQIVQAWIDLEEHDSSTSELLINAESGRSRLLAGERFHDQHVIKLLFMSYPYDPASAATVDEVWIRTSDEEPTAGTDDMLMNTPDAVFGPGHAAFFDRGQNTLHRLQTRNFYFPIPRV